MRECFKLLGNELSVIVQDYYKPEETLICLKSLRENLRFAKYEIILCTNEAVNNYSYEYYKRGYCDKLILSRKNEGLAFSLIRAVEYANTPYILFSCNDNAISRPIEQEEFDRMKLALEPEDVGLINFAFIKPWSERLFLIKRDEYLKIDFSGGSIGPWRALPTTSEMDMQAHFEKNNKKVIQWSPNCLQDLGKYSIEETESQGIFKHRRDVQQLWVLRPPKRREASYEFNDQEWDLILSGRWRGGTIPEAKKKWSFYFFSNEPDPLDPE